MKRIGIFYGSLTGTTEAVARRIGQLMGIADADIHNVADTAPDVLGNYDLILAGSSTWGSGELEDSWYSFFDGAMALSMAGKEVAVFGCGDETMADTFCNAVGELAARFAGMGASIVGKFNADGYHYAHSAAQDGDVMVGLVIDDVNHPDLTPPRIRSWVELLMHNS